jgi:hypothetical protein
VPGTRQTWWGGYEDTVAIAEGAAGRPLKPSEVSRYWFGRAFTYIRQEPAEWLRLTLRKALAFVGGVELPNNEPYEARRAEYWSLRLVPLGFGLIFGLALMAVPLRWWRGVRPAGAADADDSLRRGFIRLMLAFVLVYSLSVVAFFVTGRYRVPLIPFVIMGSAVTLSGIGALLAERRVLAALGVAAGCAVLVAALKVDYFGVRQATRGFAELTDGQDRLAIGDLDGAIAGLEKVRARGSVQAPELYTTLVRAYFERNRPGDMPAIAVVVREGLSLYPDDVDLMWYAVLCAATPGNEAEFPRALERYLSHRPDDVRALLLAFRASLLQGRLTEARRFLSRVEAAKPDHPLLAKMREQLARADAADGQGRREQEH